MKGMIPKTEMSEIQGMLAKQYFKTKTTAHINICYHETLTHGLQQSSTYTIEKQQEFEI